MKIKLKKHLSLFLAFVMVCSCLASIPSKAEETVTNDSSIHTWDFDDETQADDFVIQSKIANGALAIDQEGYLTANSVEGNYTKAVLNQNYNISRVSVDIVPVEEKVDNTTTTYGLDAHLLLGVTGTTVATPTGNDAIDIRYEDKDNTTSEQRLKVYVREGTGQNIIFEKTNLGLYTDTVAKPVNLLVEIVDTRMIITITEGSNYVQHVVDLKKDFCNINSDVPIDVSAARLQGRVGFAVDGWEGQAARFDNLTIVECTKLTEGRNTWDFSDTSQADDFEFTKHDSAESMYIEGESLKTAAPNNNSGYSKAVLMSDYDLQSVSVDISHGTTSKTITQLWLGIKGTIRKNTWSQGNAIYIQINDENANHNQFGLSVKATNGDANGTTNELFYEWFSSNSLYDTNTVGSINLKVDVDETKLVITLSSLEDKSLYIQRIIDIAEKGLTKDALLGRVGLVNNGWHTNGTSSTVGTATFDNLTIVEKDAPETWDFTYGAQAEDFGFKTDNPTNGFLSIDKETGYLTPGTTIGYKHAFLNETYENVKSFSVDVYPLAIEKTVDEKTITVENVRADVFFGLQGENFAGSNYAHTIRLVWADYEENNNYKKLSLIYYNVDKDDKTELANWDSPITSAGLYTGSDAQPVNITVNLKGTVIEVTVTALVGSDNPVSYTNKVDVAEKNLTSDIFDGRIGLGSMSWINSVDNQTARAQFDNFALRTYNTEVEQGGTSLQGKERWMVAKNLTFTPNTIEAWIKVPETTCNDDEATILSTQVSSPSIDFKMGTYGRPVFTWQDAVGNQTRISANEIDLRTGNWTHLAMVRDAENSLLSIYLNGEAVYTLADTSVSDINLTRLCVGQEDNSLRVANLRAWSNTLTKEELQKSMWEDDISTQNELLMNFSLDEKNKSGNYEDASQYKNYILDTDILKVKYQTDEGVAEEKTDRYKIRFISSLNTSAEYQEAGFVLMRGDNYQTGCNMEIGASKTATVSTKKLYHTLNVNGEAVSAVDYYGNSYQKYFFAFEMTFTPAQQELCARAYVKLVSGEILYGDVNRITSPAVKNTAQTYQNNIQLTDEWNLETESGSGDPFVLRYNGRYYMYPSSLNSTTEKVVKVWESDDLINWRYKGNAAQGDEVANAYAPEVIYYNGTFYMTGSPGGSGHYILKSDNPLGPFEVITDNFGKKIDGSFYVDDEGKLYFLYAEKNSLYISKIEDLERMIPGEGILLSPSMEKWTEAPGIFRRNGILYMTYSGNEVHSKGYRVGYGYSMENDPMGDFTVPKDNLILLNVNDNGNFNGLGHNSNFVGPNLDSWYTAYHTLLNSRLPFKRGMMIDQFVTNGSMLLANGPTYSEVTVPERPDFEVASAVNGFRSDTMTDEIYTIEYNVTPKAGETMDLLFAYQSTDNYEMLQWNMTDESFALYTVQNGEKAKVKSCSLKGLVPDKLHTIRVEKGADKLNVYVDGMLKLEASADGIGAGKIGVDGEGSFHYLAYENETFGTSDFETIKNVPSAFPAVHYLKEEGRGYQISNATVKENGIRQNEPENTKVNEADGVSALVLDTTNDWVKYAVNVMEEATYGISAMISPQCVASKIQVTIDERKSYTFTIADAGDINSDYVHLMLGEIPLTEGTHTIKVKLLSGLLDVQKFQFAKVATGTVDSTQNANWIYTGAWETQDEAMVIPTPELEGTRSYASFNQTNLTDFSMEIDIAVLEECGAYDGGILFHTRNLWFLEHDKNFEGVVEVYRTRDVEKSLQGYYLSVTNSKISLERCNYNSKTVCEEAATFPVGTYQTLRLEMRNNHILVYLGDATTPIIDHYDDNAFLSGQIALCSFGANMGFKNIIIKN